MTSLHASGPAEATDDVPVLRFEVESVEADRTAAVPALLFKVRVEATGPRAVKWLALDVDLRLAADRRRYQPGDHERLREIFGDRCQWSQSLKGLPWAHTTVNVASFDGVATVSMRVPCTYDFDVVAAKYLAALNEGDIPVEIGFAGSIFYDRADGRLQIVPLPSDLEASTRLPVATWKSALDCAFPHTAWLRLSRDVFDRLHELRSRRGFTTWEQTIESVLSDAEASHRGD